jgi:hypothetical protein
MRKLLFSSAVALVMAASGTAFAVQPSSHSGTHNASQSQARSSDSDASASNLTYPPCSKSRTDSCIELGYRKELDQANREYPKCAQIQDVSQKARCIESGFKQSKAE